MMRIFSRLERFDTLALLVIIGLLLLMGAVIAAGDHAGVTVSATDPVTGDTLDSPQPMTTAFYLRFSEEMDLSTVHLRFTPEMQGTLQGSGTQLTFTPKTSFMSGQRYVVVLESGARAKSGRRVQRAMQWDLLIRQPGIAYLSPAIRVSSSDVTRLYRLGPNQAPEPLTDESTEVEDYAPSPDGSQIAFTKREPGGKTDLYLVQVADKSIQRLTNCVDALCRAPSWSPDGTRIVYERADSAKEDTNIHAWIVDVRTLATEPLFTEQRWLGKQPRWSRDGRTITLYDRDLSSIVLVNLDKRTRSLIQTLEDDPGQLSFDSTRLVYAQLATTPQGVIRQLEIADFGGSEHTVHPLDPIDGALVDDTDAVWNPDGVHLAVMRRYLGDDRATEKFQVYQIDVTTGDAMPLVVDPNYAHGALSWRPDGEELLMQRYPFLQPNALPAIWTYDVRSKTLTQLIQNGYSPRWLP